MPAVGTAQIGLDPAAFLLIGQANWTLMTKNAADDGGRRCRHGS